jgi:hypothetical protein
MAAPTDHHGNSSGMAEDEAAPEQLCRLLDLPAELLVTIAAQLAEDDELAASLACRKLRAAVAGTERGEAGARLSTTIGSALVLVGKLEWAASCGMPLSAKLLTRVARLGQLETLRWLRGHGCAWEPCERGREGPCSSAAARPSVSAAVGARGWLPVGLANVLTKCSSGWAPGRAPVGPCQWLLVVCGHLLSCS